MPKKKLTKAQVKKQFKTIMSNMEKMFADKMGQPDSFVPMSMNNLILIHKKFSDAFKRIK